jgi:hypothetical protein
MTAANMFKNHPNKAKIKFLVVPFAKECMHLCNDLIGPIKTVYDIYSKPENCFGLNFDFSLMNCYGTEATW